MKRDMRTGTPDDADLTAKLEAATEGTRELDYAIAEALGRENVRKTQGTFAPWKYTTSIDAALTLVPEGWVPTLYFPDPSIQTDSCLCLLGLPGTREAKGQSPTMPLAICIAALKELAAPTVCTFCLGTGIKSLNDRRNPNSIDCPDCNGTGEKP